MRFLLITSIFVLGLAAACGSPSGNTNSKSPNSNAANMNTAASNGYTSLPTPPPAANCPTEPMDVVYLMDRNAGAATRFNGCTVGVKGKLWDVNAQVATVIPATDRTLGTTYANCGGDFSAATYSSIASGLADKKTRGQYDALPVVTFSCKVDGNGYLSQCVLQDASRY